MTESAATSFRVRLLEDAKTVRQVVMTGPSTESVRADVERQGHVCLSVEAQTSAVARQGKASKFSLLVFCQQLLALLDAGLQLVEAVVALSEKERDPHHRRVLLSILSDLESGLPFSSALERQSEVFPSMLCAAVRASEQTGGTPEALRRFVNYEGKFQALKSKLMGALIYPATLLAMGALVSLFLLAYVVPRFGGVFADRIAEMPYLSGLIIRMGLFISAHPWSLLLGAVGLLLGAGALVVNPALRLQAARQVRRLPWLGPMLRTIELARIYRALGMLIGGGVPAVQALTISLGVASGAERANLEKSIELIKEGQPFSQALKEHKLTTPVCERLIVAGERSGQMADMMNRSADFLDFELEQALDRLMKLLEPVLMVVIGGIIGGIVILMYLPIFELADSLQ